MNLLKTSFPKERSVAFFTVRVLSVMLGSLALVSWWVALIFLVVPGIDSGRGDSMLFFFLGLVLAAMAVGLRLMHRWAVVAYSGSASLFLVASLAYPGISLRGFWGDTLSFVTMLAVFSALFLWDRRGEFK